MPLLSLTSAVFAIQPYIGQTEGDLTWHIAGNGVNILSQLDYKQVTGTTYGLKAELSDSVPIKKYDHWKVLARLNINGTDISDGQYRDSDYNGNNRTEEFSRSIGDVPGDSLENFTIGFGLDYPLTDNHHLRAWWGAFNSEQHINFRNATQIISSPPSNVALGPLEGLDSDYATDWDGYWSAFGWHYHLKKVTLNIEAQGLWGQYYGIGRWNLRNDFAQPLSFFHSADMRGWRVNTSALVALNPQWSLEAGIRYGELTSSSGVDVTYFSSGMVTEALFNGAQWKTLNWHLGLAYQW